MSLPINEKRQFCWYFIIAALIAALLSFLFFSFFLHPLGVRIAGALVLALLLGAIVFVSGWLCRRVYRWRCPEVSEERVSALPRLARLINSSLDIGETYHAFIAQLSQYLPIDRAGVALVNELGDEFRLFALSARSRTELEQGRYYPLERSHVESVINHGRQTLADDIGTSNYWDWKVIAEEGITSALDVPLREPAQGTANPGRVIGVFSLGAYQLSAYQEADLSFMNAVGEHLACAVSNARAHEEARERIRWLEKMHHLEDSLGRTLAIDEMLRIVSDHAVQTMQADRALVVLPENYSSIHSSDFGNQWCHLAGPGIRQDSGKHTLADFGPLVTTVVERKAPMLSRLVSEESIIGTPLEAIYYNEGIRSLAVMPILLVDDCLGILLIGWRREGAVAQESLQMLQDLAAHLGTALRNASLVNSLKTANQGKSGN